ncbi:Glu/Leu/Phe/Val dehydrogenase dimerization domain-containing protein [Actinomadura sp. B10D3]|uniref:Glu/Leu/Phe/Val dehydrogenase family protein n=1 Tax=Actinomadura sp. B10D3 TaxID=3153557 RepID=UPI00325E23AA
MEFTTLNKSSDLSSGLGFSDLEAGGFEQIVVASDAAAGMRLVVAIHSTALGPAAGGLRIWPYASERDAVVDAMRLAQGMTLKYAAAGVDLGGGKAVLVGKPLGPVEGEARMRAVGRVVESLGGRFRIGADVGSTLDDMEHIFTETDHVNTLPEDLGGVGDISYATARGTVAAMRACAERAWGRGDLRGRRIAVQGLGMVGEKAARMLADQGAELIIADIDDDRVARVTRESGARPVAPEEIHRQDVDVFAPFALGAVVNDDTIGEIKAKVVVGSANNVLAEDRHAHELVDRGIIYGVDFIANAGGAIYDADRLRKGGFVARRALAKVDAIGDRIRQTFQVADAERITPLGAAYRLAERRLADFSAKRAGACRFG